MTTAHVRADPRAPLDEETLRLVDAYWRAANYVSVGQIYLLANPLLREPLLSEHVKPRLLGHFGTTPGLNLVYVHLNRAIRERNLDAIFVTGPGTAAPVWSRMRTSRARTRSSTRTFDPTRRAAEVVPPVLVSGRHPEPRRPRGAGLDSRGGELGYALVHAFGAAFDNPDLLVACVVGDGEAETGPLAASWHSNKFLNPARDGAVLPILHLNGYKIANPTVLARIPEAELLSLFEGYGYRPYTVEGDEPAAVHQAFAATLDAALDEIAEIQRSAREDGVTERPRWPLIVLRTPKGWTGPKEVDGLPVEGTWRAHQVPIADVKGNADHLRMLEQWLRSYRPEELFDGTGDWCESSVPWRPRVSAA